jgi:hypothetical protein
MPAAGRGAVGLVDWGVGAATDMQFVVASPVVNLDLKILLIMGCRCIMLGSEPVLVLMNMTVFDRRRPCGLGWRLRCAGNNKSNIRFGSSGGCSISAEMSRRIACSPGCCRSARRWRAGCKKWQTEGRS